MRKNTKYIVFIIGMIVFMLSALSVTYASGTYKTIKVWYGDLKIVSNGTPVADEVQPFIVNGTTYVPLRMMGTVFNKNIHYDSMTNSIYITDQPTFTSKSGSYLDYLQTGYRTDLEKVVQLEARIKELEQELDYYTDYDRVDLDDFEDELNDDYDRLDDIRLEIDLNRDAYEIEVVIEVDLDEYNREWKKLSHNEIEDYIDDIVDEVQDEFKDISIKGYIEDTETNDKILTFTTDSRGRVEVYAMELSDLEDVLEDDYEDFGDMEFDIDLRGDKDDIEVLISVDLDEYDWEWRKLSEEDIENYIEDIVKDILDEFDDADIAGAIEDRSDEEELFTFRTSNNGRLHIEEE